MDEYIRAQAKYLKQADNRARAKGISVTDYLETRTTLFQDELKRESVPLVNRMEDRARASTPPLEEPLPERECIVSVCVTEPKGRFRFELVIPDMVDIFVDSLRNEHGYKQAFVEAILYKFYGQIG